jgi:hypothetical protein
MVMKTLMKIVVVVAMSVLVGRGFQGFMNDRQQAVEMAALWEDFLEVPRDFRQPATAVATGLVAGWETPPNDEQRVLLEQEIAPRVSHIMANNGQFGNKMWKHYLPAVEHKLADASW